MPDTNIETMADALIAALEHDYTLYEIIVLNGFGTDRGMNTTNEPDPLVLKQMVGECVIEAVYSYHEPGLLLSYLFDARPTWTRENDRVLQAVLDLIDVGMLVEQITGMNKLRLDIPDPQKLMDFVGLWPEGFEPPEDTPDLIYSTPEGQAMFANPAEHRDTLSKILGEVVLASETHEHNPFHTAGTVGDA